MTCTRSLILLTVCISLVCGEYALNSTEEKEAAQELGRELVEQGIAKYYFIFTVKR